MIFFLDKMSKSDIIISNQLEQAYNTNPEMWIGEIRSSKRDLYIRDKEKFIKKNINFNPGLYKLFDEIIVNATDHYTRTIQEKTILVTEIRVNRIDDLISISNDGQPISILKKYNVDGVEMPAPQFVFTRMFTSTNYDKTKKGAIGGMNGLGAGLVALFSKYFSVEILNAIEHKRWFQEFKDKSGTSRGDKLEDFKNISEPLIEEYKGTKNLVKISFIPLFSKFKKDGKPLSSYKDDQTIDFIIKRIYDLPILFNCKFFFNDLQIKYTSFNTYMSNYEGVDTKTPIVLQNDKWNIVISAIESQEIISYVNGIYVFGGGTHVEAILKMITDTVSNELKGKRGYDALKPAFIKNHLFIFITGLVDNSTFDSQSKEKLTVDPSELKGIPKLDETNVKKMLNEPFGLIKYIKGELAAINVKELTMASKTNKRATDLDIQKHFPKLDDATADKSKIDCTLILCEGDSAKGFISSGTAALPEKEKAKYGVFPLRGKIINAMAHPKLKVMQNKEHQALRQIIGLEDGIDYSIDANYKRLKYKHILLACDADVDGFHIQSLVLCLFYVFYPSLLKRKGFFQSLVTPIIKVGGLQFNYESEYKKWVEKNPSKQSAVVEYFKGLGGFTVRAAEQIFKELNERIFNFLYTNEKTDKETLNNYNNTYKISFYKRSLDKENLNDVSIKLAFQKDSEGDSANFRKEWINAYLSNQDLIIEFKGPDKTIHEFINNELVMFSAENVSRMIPALIDGLKPVQRKILYVIMKSSYDKVEKKQKVATLGSEVTKKTGYKHGPVSMEQAIIGLAQGYTESNNVPLLVPEGQFGTRIEYGDDAGSSRYVHTYKHPIFHKIFRPEDNIIYEYVFDEGMQLEPKFLYPIVPMVLINRAEGIATGWSSRIPSFDIKDIILNIKNYIRTSGKFDSPFIPFYKGFKGKIYANEKGDTFYSEGVFQLNPTSNSVTIKEVPIGMSYEMYRRMLLGTKKKENSENTDKKKTKKTTTTANKVDDKSKFSDEIALIKKHKISSVDEYAGATVELEIIFNSGYYDKETKDKEEFIKKYGLRSKIISIPFLTSPSGAVVEYPNHYIILIEYIKERLRMYGVRKERYIIQLENEIKRLMNIIRFLRAVVNEHIILTKISQPNLIILLTEKKFDKYDDSYSYLYSIPAIQLTTDNMLKRENELKEKQRILEEYRKKTPEEIWINELDELSKEL